MEQSAWTRTANGANKRLVLHVRLGVTEFGVRSVWQGQVSLAAVNQICVVYEAVTVAQI